MVETATKGDVAVIKDFFGYRPNEGASDFLKELRGLDLDSRKQLAEGIRNGSLTY